MLTFGAEARQGPAPGAESVVRSKPRGVYLAGSGPTGSTLLALLLNAHPAIASGGEIAVKPKIRHGGRALRQKCSCGALISECAFWRRVFQKVTDEGLKFGPTQWTNDYHFTHPLVHRLLTRDSSLSLVRAGRCWIERCVPMYRQRLRRIDRVNDAFVRAVLETAGAEVFVDTSKVPTRLARLLTSGAFDLRVVTLVRDIRGYAFSARRRGKSLRDAALTWTKDQLSIRAAAADLSADRRSIVRYEDLCADPAGTLRRLHAFCGVALMDCPRPLFTRDHHVLGNKMRLEDSIEIRLDQRWRNELTTREQEAVLRIGGRLNAELGYLR
jgi:hypothetical protein